MLTPDEVERIADATLKAFTLLESGLRSDAAVALTDPLHVDRANLLDKLTRTAHANAGAIEQSVIDAMTDAAHTSLLTDEQIYGAARTAGLVREYVPLAQSVTLDQVLRDGIATATNMTNIVGTSAVQAVNAEFTAALDKALISTVTGSQSMDAAIREAVKSIATKQTDVTYVTSDGVLVKQNIYSAVRRAVVTASNQTTLRMQEARLGEVGANYVEVTAHAGARPEHAAWQGQVYLFSDLGEATGYGSGDGLGGWNCVVGDTLVSGPPPCTAYRREYSGELVILTTASGKKLTVTPNHPILTTEGWVAAGLLDEGSYVICRSTNNSRYAAMSCGFRCRPQTSTATGPTAKSRLYLPIAFWMMGSSPLYLSKPHKAASESLPNLAVRSLPIALLHRSALVRFVPLTASWAGFVSASRSS